MCSLDMSRFELFIMLKCIGNEVYVCKWMGEIAKGKVLGVKFRGRTRCKPPKTGS